MKPNLCLWRRVFLTGLLGSLPSLGMAGSVIVNFNSPIYTASNWQCFTGWVDGAPTMTFSDQNFLSPTAHYNTALPSSKFYGGASATGTGGLGLCKIADGVSLLNRIISLRLRTTLLARSVYLFYGNKRIFLP